MKRLAILIPALLLLASQCHADTTASKPSSVELTVYNQNFALVKEQRDGKDFVTQVRRPGGSAGQSAPVSNNQATTAPQAAPAPKPTWNGGGKSPEESEKITRLSVMSTAANAAQILTGQITDPVVLGDVVVGLYNKFLAEIKK